MENLVTYTIIASSMFMFLVRLRLSSSTDQTYIGMFQQKISQPLQKRHQIKVDCLPTPA